MSEWKTYKLGDHIHVKHGFAFKGQFFSDQPTENILLTPGNFNIGGGFKSGKLKYYDGEIPEDYILSEGDILITMTDLSKAGDTLGYSAKVPSHNDIKYLHNQRLGLVELLNDELDLEYIYWLLRTRRYQYYIVSTATGSTVRHTSPKRIYGYEFGAPTDKKEQRQIAATLSCLDNKIELNLQMNETLENMAEAIFKEWFVDFNFPGFNGELVDGLPKGWKWGTIGDFSDNIRDSWRPDQGSKNLNYVGLEHIPRKSIMISEWGKSSDINSQKSKFKTGDILFGKLRPYFHKVITAPFDGICSTDILVIRSKELFIQLYLYFHLYSDNCIKYSNSHSSGTRMPRVNWKSLSNYEIPLPPKDILEAFQEVLSPIFNKVHKSIYANEYLINTRNTLLSKLMNGQILKE